MGKTSRDKGANGEREFVRHANAAGVRAVRTAQLQAGRVAGVSDTELLDHPDLFVEVKRDERMSVDRMVAQALGDSAKADPPRTPIVAYRRNDNPWRVVLPASLFFALLNGRADI